MTSQPETKMKEKRNDIRRRFPLLYAYSIDYTRPDWGEVWAKRVEKAQREKDDMLKRSATLFPYVNTYLKSRLHDSWVVSCELSGNVLIIRLNDFETHCFCEALLKTLGKYVPHKKVVMPLALRFMNLRRIVFGRVNKNGKLLPLNINRYLPLLSEYFGDEVECLDENGISIGIVFLLDVKKWTDSGLTFDIEAERLEFQEGMRDAFAGLFGADLLHVYDFYKEARPGYYFDYSSSLKFLAEHSSELGLPLRDVTVGPVRHGPIG